MKEGLYWDLVNGAKELSDMLGDAIEEMEHGDIKTAKEIITEVREDLTGYVVKEK